MKKENVRFYYDGLPDDLRLVLLAQIRDLWTHSSTAIEGNKLTLAETSFILEEGLTISGKSLKDHREVYDHAKAIDLIYALSPSDKLCKEDVFKLHRAILTEAVMDIYAPVGAWKNEPNSTSFVSTEGRVAIREYPYPERIEGLMAQWIDEFNLLSTTIADIDSAVRAYAKLHLDFVTIHPFYDGNGRLARLLSNIPLIRSGFPPIIVPAQDKNEYKKSISDYQGRISELQNLDDLNKLPIDNAFQSKCKTYYRETADLIESAFEIAAQRVVARKPK